MKSLSLFIEHSNNKTTDDVYISFIQTILKQNGGKISVYDVNDAQVILNTIYLSKNKKDVLADCDPDTEIKNGTPLIDLINDIDDWYTISDAIKDII